MARRFEDRVIFVTGGTSGLGAVSCELFREEGAKVFITDIEERDVYERFGSDATFHKCDVSDPKSCFAAIQACIDKFGRLDVLFHNGARLSPIKTVVDIEVEDFQNVINTNLCGAFYLAKATIPYMRKQGRGVIVNTSSISGIRADYGLAPYNAAKAGLINLTRTMAIDHVWEGIRAVTICPGYMETRITAGMAGNEDLENLLFGSNGIPMGRPADLREVARAVLFLASDDASYITGHPLIVDGGWIAHNPSPPWGKYVN